MKNLPQTICGRFFLLYGHPVTLPYLHGFSSHYLSYRMPLFADLYFLVNTRSKDVCKVILDYCAPLRTSSIDFLEGAGEKGCHTEEELMDYLELNPEVENQLYWHNPDNASLIDQVNIFHTNDGYIIAGVAVPSQYGDEEAVIDLYRNLKDYIKPVISCITVEEMCPLNSVEFAAFCRERSMP